MGNECFASTSNKLYQKQLQEINLNELKSQWTLIKSCKIKRMFERLANKPSTQKQQLRVSYEGFCQMFPEFIRYEEMQKKRIYEIFDRQNHGFVTWSDFYSSISICYFASQKILSTLLFMIFDQHLEKEIDELQLSLLVDLNALYLKQQKKQGSVVQLDPEQVVQQLLKDKKSIDLNFWLANSSQFFDFNQFRRFFNIFKEQKLQKQLVQNYHDWNYLYDPQQDKYISYIISYKWFETWKMYVENQYGLIFNIEDKNPVTLKSIKTKKTFKTSNSNKSKKHLVEHPITMKKILGSSNSSIIFNNSDFIGSHTKNNLEYIRNFDMVRNNLGERPKQIYNHLLEGQFAGTFKAGLVQNRDYVFVSQKVWNYLTEIYNGEPQFRRTGFDQIELYPKMVRIYAGNPKGQIEFASQTYRQISNYRTIQDLLTKYLQVSNNQLDKINLYYRTVGMPTWCKIENYADAFIDLTPQPLIFIVYIQNKGDAVRKFQLKYFKISRSIEQSNLGDILLYEDSSTKISKQVLFFNRTSQNKFIIHFMGQSYTNDLCLNQKEFYKYCKVNRLPENITKSHKKKTKIDKRNKGIQDIKNLSFVTSIILLCFQNKKISELLIEVFKRYSSDKNQENKNYLTVILSYIHHLLKTNQKVDPRSVIHLVQVFFPQFSNFDITQRNQFINQFYTKIKDQAEILGIKDTFARDYEFSLHSKTKCLKCGNIEEDVDMNMYTLSVQIPQRNQTNYQIIYVPFCFSLYKCSIRKYGFQLPKSSTLKEYKNKFIEVAQLKNKNFILLEIQGNIVIKNYSYVKDEQATLQNLQLRESDTIFAYQLGLDFSVFIKNHFSFTQSDNLEIEQKDLKVGEMIDCKHPQKGWIAGKIVEKQILPYTYQENLKVLHKINNTKVECSYQVAKNVVAYFPSQSYKNCEHYHLKVMQRFFSEAHNQMIYCNVPLVVALPSWMRIKQFHYLIYTQIKRFISPQFDFQQESTPPNYLSSTIEKSIVRQTTKMKVKKFKQYLYGKQLPYKISFIDNSGRCLICYKFVKSTLHNGEEQQYCVGCPLSNQEPVSWQISVNGLVIALDWKNNWSFKSDVIRNHSSYVNLSNKKKKDIQTIESCLKKTLNQSGDSAQMICCNMNVDITTVKIIPRFPNYLIISLERMVQENGFKKSINIPVYFGDEKITLQGQQYKLLGVIASKGHQNNIGYTTYIKDSRESEKNRWMAYNGQRVQIVKKQQIDKRCTLILFYEKIKGNQNKLQIMQEFHHKIPQEVKKNNNISLSFQRVKQKKKQEIQVEQMYKQLQDQSDIHGSNNEIELEVQEGQLRLNAFEISQHDFTLQ